MNTAIETINWTNLLVTDSEGNTTGETLGSMVATAPANLDSATWSDNGISEWPDFFLSAEGEEPDFDTPRVTVDWTGFGDAMRVACGSAE